MIDLSSATIRKQTEALDELIKKPIHSISPDALATYETEYFGKKCVKSYEMIQEAKKYIPGGVQHNLAFNHPFPPFSPKRKALIWKILTATAISTFCKPVAQQSWAQTPEVREKVIELLNTCGPSTGLFHEYEYRIAKLVTELIPSVTWLRMLNSAQKPAWQLSVLPDWRQSTGTFSKWVARTMAGVTNTPMASACREANLPRLMVSRSLFSGVLMSFSQGISIRLNVNSDAIHCVAERLP